MPEEEERDRRDRAEERETATGRPLSPDANDPRTGDPHSSLNNPADNPDETEYPDPYERRPDPRDPDRDGVEVGTPRAPSTSEPHPPRNYDELKPVKGDRED